MNVIYCDICGKSVYPWNCTISEAYIVEFKTIESFDLQKPEDMQLELCKQCFRLLQKSVKFLKKKSENPSDIKKIKADRIIEIGD